MKILSKIITTIVCLNLIFTPFYPVLAYAQWDDSWYYDQDSSTDQSEEPASVDSYYDWEAPAEPVDEQLPDEPEQEAPPPEPEPAPEEEAPAAYNYYDPFLDYYGYSDAGIQPADAPQEGVPDSQGDQPEAETPETPPAASCPNWQETGSSCSECGLRSLTYTDSCSGQQESFREGDESCTEGCSTTSSTTDFSSAEEQIYSEEDNSCNSNCVVVTDENSQQTAVDLQAQWAGEAVETSEQGQAAARELYETANLELAHTLNNTVSDAAEGIVSYNKTIMGNIGQTISGVFEATTNSVQKINEDNEKRRLDKELYEQEKAAETQNEQTRKAIEEAVNASPEEKAAKLKLAFGLPEGTTDEVVLEAAKNALEEAGVTLEGDLNNFTIAIPKETVTTSEETNVALEMGLDFATNGIYTWNKARDESQRLQNEMWPKYESLGIEERSLARYQDVVFNGNINTYYSGEKFPEYFDNTRFKAGGANGNSFGRTISAREIEDDIRLLPDLGDPEKNKQREALLEEAKKADEARKELALQTGYTAVGAAAGGEILPNLPKMAKGLGELTIKAPGALFDGVKNLAGSLNPFKAGEKEIAQEVGVLRDLPSSVLASISEGNFSLRNSFSRSSEQEVKKYAQSLGIDIDATPFMNADGIINVARYDDYLRKQIVDHPDVKDITLKIFGYASSEDKALVAEALTSGLDEKALIQVTSLNDDILTYLSKRGNVSLNLDDLPSYLSGHEKEVTEAIEAMRYQLPGAYFEGNNAGGIILRPDLKRALIRKADGLNRIKPVLEEAGERIQAVKDFCLKYGKRNSSCANIDVAASTTENNNIHALVQTEFDDLVDKIMPEAKGKIGGFHATYEDQIVIPTTANAETITHECIHRICAWIANRDEVAALTDTLGSEKSARAILEGVTETVSALGKQLAIEGKFDLAGVKQLKTAYSNQVDFVTDVLVPAIKKQNSSLFHKMSDEEAMAIIAQAGTGGGYNESLVKAVGGADKLKQLINDHPDVLKRVISNELSYYPPLEQKRDKGFSLIPEVLAVENQPQSSTSIRSDIVELDRLITPFDVSLAMQGARIEIGQKGAVDTQVFESLVKQRLVKDALIQDRKVSSDFVKLVAKTDIIQPETALIDSGLLMQTGKAGTVEDRLDAGAYAVEVMVVPAGMDIKVPQAIHVSGFGSLTVPLEVKAGQGRIEKGDVIVQPDSPKEASVSVQTQVKLAVFNQGLKKVVPLAGLQVRLEKIDQEKKLSLLAGWNLITLTALPQNALTASNLIEEINKQGGQATTVSTLVDEAWKTYVVREDKSYTGEDFAIEMGKAYFIKTLQKSAFTFMGQKLAAPIKLKLASGWNAVGFPFMSKDYKASDLLSTTSADTTARWESGLWDAFVLREKQKYGEDFIIRSNRGYLLKVDKEKEFSP